MKVLLNYANERFAELQRRNCETGLAVAGFDRVLAYGPADIDAQFAAKNCGILSQKRGNGYWLWKPYFIVRTLESLAAGDWLFYCDSGAHFVASIDPLIEVGLRDGQDVIPFELSLCEQHWTKRDAFVCMDCDRPEFRESRQRLASFHLWRCSPAALQLARQWLELAQDERLLTDLPNQCGLPNHDGFQDHRHDQSIFSLLTKKHGLRGYRNPSQNGNYARQRYPQSTYGQLIQHTRRGKAPLVKRVWKQARKSFRAWSDWLTGTDRATASRPHAA
ncbi:MAG: hypothetical protein L0211_17745 [Planctomycetaceae bacterium]|nr:hypothetical protein [Planctomycetaceae bacterium]